MIFGHGIDLTEIERIKKADMKNPHFARKVLTENEWTYFNELKGKRRFAYLAGRFSAKEAYSKALGTGIGKFVSLQAVEILNDASGKPYINKHPRLGLLKTHLSISHTDSLVMTSVILEEINS